MPTLSLICHSLANTKREPYFNVITRRGIKSDVAFILLLACFFTPALVAQISFTPAAGLFDDPVSVSVAAASTTVIHYTTNGDTPTRKSRRLVADEVLEFDKNTVLRTLAIATDGTETLAGASYLIGEPESKLPVISVGIDNYRLFNEKHGWFKAGPRADSSHWKIPGANWWSKKEHLGHLDMLESYGTSMFSGEVGYRMFGGMSRLHPQKSLSVSCRKRYGTKRIDYPVFGADDPQSFKFLVFRNGGSDWSRSHFRDALLSDLLHDKSWDIDHQANRPALLYINGKYWGLYHIREKINKTFLADHHGYDKDSLDLLEHAGTPKAGTDREYSEMLDFIDRNGFYEVAKYRALGEKMDIDNFMRLQIAQMYFDNRDAGGNIRYFRPHVPDGVGVQKWKWILYDLDYSFGLHDEESYAHNTLAMYAQVDGPEWPNPPWSTRIQRKLLANDTYRRLFINRSLDYLQTDFKAEKVTAAINHRAATLESEMPRALARWNLSLDNWYLHIERMREFARLRPEYLKEHIRSFFSAGADREVWLESTKGGSIVLNDNIAIGQGEWKGHYFANIPIRLRAQANPGYQFVGWENTAEDRARQPEQDVSLMEDRQYVFRATFEPYIHTLEGQLVITEIAGLKAESGAWIEIHNRGEETVSIRDWLLTDEANHEIRLPAAEILADEHLVLYADEESFVEVYGEVISSKYIPQLNRIMNHQKLGLYSQRGALVDMTSFRPGKSIVQGISGSGAANHQAKNWHATTHAATPGGANEMSAFYLSWQSGDIWWRIGALCVVIGILFRGIKKLNRSQNL